MCGFKSISAVIRVLIDIDIGVDVPFASVSALNQSNVTFYTVVVGVLSRRGTIEVVTIAIVIKTG